MKVATVTAHARAICEPGGVQCRYEFDAGRWRWNFYRDGVKVRGTSQYWTAPTMAQKVVDMGKLLTYPTIVD